MNETIERDEHELVSDLAAITSMTCLERVDSCCFVILHIGSHSNSEARYYLR